MKTSILKKVKRDNVSQIKLLFHDILGAEKTLTIPVSKIDELFNKNIWIDASDVEGLLSICDDEMYLFPKTDSYSIVMKHEGEINAIIKCDVFLRDGSLYKKSLKNEGKLIITEAKNRGYGSMSEDELVNFLFTNINLKSFESKIYC
ncbi:MAG TPA: hypothetical protein DDX39_07620 [Bacteroidales bacterium]|nr:MAG: hypothetical protein A2W98_14495 [Bacteroidetes bacterium GWF2_33_38]HBF88493.1 hypothetical protein [Bacteroidales bacterium]